MEKGEWDVLREDLMDIYLLLGIITVIIYTIAFYLVFHSIIAIFLIITFWIVTIGPILYGLETEDKKFIAGGVILSIFFGYFFISSGMSSNQPVYLRIFAFIYFNQFWLAPLITLILRAKGVKISLKALGERANVQQKLPESRRTSSGEGREQISPISKSESPESPVCDVCNKKMNWEDGYVLSTNQVATAEAYWEFVFTHRWAIYHEGPSDTGALIALLVHQQAGQSTGWLVCEKCSTLFDFDREVGKKHAQMHSTAPPGGGPANPQLVASAAVNVWKKLYGEYPK